MSGGGLWPTPPLISDVPDAHRNGERLRIEHLLRVRELQARTGGFTAFICWPLQPEGTEMAGLYGLTVRASVIAASARFLPMILP